MFTQSVKGFLKRYQADAKFAQEARKKAKGVQDGNVELICPVDIRPLALRLLCRGLKLGSFQAAWPGAKGLPPCPQAGRVAGLLSC